MVGKGLNYSELVYLNAEYLVPAPSFLQNKEELPDGKKVSVVKLGNLTAEAAFAYLYFNGHVDLEFKTKRRFGIIPRKVVVSNKISDGTNLSSLEKSIFDLSDGADVSSILYRIIGDECAIPWAVITSIVKEALVNKKILNKETITKKILITFTTYKYHFCNEKETNFGGERAEVKDKLKEFSRMKFYKLLVKSINSGISAQKEKSDTGSD